MKTNLCFMKCLCKERKKYPINRHKFVSKIHGNDFEFLSNFGL